MKKFTKKGILQKTIIVILMVLSFNFIVPAYSSAAVNFSVGGILANPTLAFLSMIVDSVESLLQAAMTGSMEKDANGFVDGFLNSKVMVDTDDDRVKKGGENPFLTVSKDNLQVGLSTGSDDYKVPVIEYTPEEIFSNKVPYLDINFITPKWNKLNSEYGVDGTAARLQNTISGWYVALRNLSIVGLLCVLVYVGIRIILSSTSADKAKYKQMFTDWLIALCLLFFLHYIMSFTLVMVDAINDAIVGDDYEASTVVISVDGENYTTNFMGATRFMVQSADTVARFAYFLLYVALVIYTGIFTWYYLKRVLMMAFLTIIAPLVAITYPIDKIGDGKAQAFNMWLKEYVYNALIQPFHLIIYMIFVGAATELAKDNIIYALVAITFILPAEKILKKMFGFDNAPLGTMGALTGFTAGTIASKIGGGKSSGGKGGATAPSPTAEEKQPRFQRTHGIDGINGAPEGYESTEKEDATKTRFDGNSSNDEPIDVDYREVNEEPRGLPGPQNDENNVNEPIDVDYKEVPLDNEEKPPVRLSNDDVEEFSSDGTKIENSEDSSNTEKRSKVGFRQGVRNLANAHGGAKNIAKRTIKGIAKGTAKTATRAVFTASGMALGLGAGLASGKGMAGVLAGMTAGKSVGQRLGNSAINTVGNAANTVRKLPSTGRRILDEFKGDTSSEDAARTKAFMKDEKVDQYIRNKMAAENNGMAPTEEEIKQEKESMRDYVNEGLTDTAEIYRAKKAEKYVDRDQAAKIARLAKERKITSKELGDEKQYKAKVQDFTQEFMDKRGLDEEAARKAAEHTLNVMKAQVGQQHNLKPKTDSGAASKATTGTSSGKKKSTSRKTKK